MITYRDWFSAGAFESGHIAPDPSNPNVVYSIGWYGTVLRLDRTTGQLATVFTPPHSIVTHGKRHSRFRRATLKRSTSECNRC
jgi:hypothetical protein